MKDFVLLSAVCIAVVVGVGWFLLPGSVYDLFRSKITVEPDSFSPPPPPPLPAKAASIVIPKRKPAPPPQVESSHQVPAGPTIPVAEVKVAPPPPVRLPAPWEVLPGEEGSALVETYGAPALSASTQDAGHMFETFIYRNERYQSIIHLEDGKVLGVALKDSRQFSKR